MTHYWSAPLNVVNVRSWHGVDGFTEQKVHCERGADIAYRAQWQLTGSSFTRGQINCCVPHNWDLSIHVLLTNSLPWEVWKSITIRMNVLFICSRNQWRSPTAEQVFRRHPSLAVLSAGTSRNAKKESLPNCFNGLMLSLWWNKSTKTA